MDEIRDLFHFLGAGGVAFHKKEKHLLLFAGQRYKFSTGIKIQIPDGYGMILKDRSGLADKYGLHVLAGVIDNGYRGELEILLVNLSHQSMQILPGDRIAQAILVPLIDAEVEEVDELSETERGEKGFGASGR